MKKYFCILILLYYNIFSEELIKNNYLSTSLKTGSVLAHRESVKNLRSQFYGIDLKYYINTNDSTFLNKYYNSPKYGFGTGIILFENQTLKGMQTLYSTIKIPIYKNNFIYFNIGSDIGLCYNYRPYNEKTNPENVLMGGMFGAYIALFSDLEFKINNNFLISAGIGVLHNSNGGTVLPNIGLNAYNASLEITYKINEKKFINPNNTVNSTNNELLINAYFGIMNTTFEKDELYKTNLFPVFGSSLEYLFKINEIYRIGIGSDIIFMGMQNYYYPDQSTNINNNFLFGIKIPMELIIGNVSLIADLGYLIIKNDEADIYKRLGLKFNIFDNIYPFIKVYASDFKAKYIEYGIYYSF